MTFELAGISKRFAGILALDDVDLDVAAKEIVGLIGPNGAGKTTLFNCALGILRADAGKVRFEGSELNRLPVHRRAKLGISRTFQRMELFAGMSPREHLLVAARASHGRAGLVGDLLYRGRPTESELSQATAMLELVGLQRYADAPVESLSLGLGRLVELARALITEPRLLLLDEPSSGLDRTETAAFTDVLRSVHQERDISILLVEHDLDMVLAISQRLFVMDQGTIIASGAPEDVIAEPIVRQAYLGISA